MIWGIHDGACRCRWLPHTRRRAAPHSVHAAGCRRRPQIARATLHDMSVNACYGLQNDLTRHNNTPNTVTRRCCVKPFHCLYGSTAHIPYDCAQDCYNAKTYHTTPTQCSLTPASGPTIIFITTPKHIEASLPSVRSLKILSCHHLLPTLTHVVPSAQVVLFPHVGHVLP